MIYPIGEYQMRELLFTVPDAHLYGLIDGQLHERIGLGMVCAETIRLVMTLNTA
jgi:hypothetical protein